MIQELRLLGGTLVCDSCMCSDLVPGRMMIADLFDEKTMKITIEEILDIEVGALATTIIKCKKKALEEVTLFDLILDHDRAQKHLHGVYFFFDPSGEKPLYIGKVQSPQFIERLPCHLAIGEGSWSNQFLKSHRDKTNTGSLSSAAHNARNCQILLLLAPPEFAPRLESLCIRLLEPAYNKRNPKSGLPAQLDETASIRSLLQ